ncbi:hypothetical protein ACQ86N_01275 [Puia sp. P3]|uniref:hypothetical protein n=1 Tax=Puia sp. P3 TaxID=3423952 RepID=UPI003D66FDBE
MIQERFDETIGLIQRHADSYPLVHQLLELYGHSILVFAFFSKPAVGNSRQRILEQYQLRMALPRRNNNSLPLSPRLLDGLRNTDHQHICISTFVTGIGIWRVFSDFGLEDLVGVLFSKNQPEQVPTYSHLFMNGVLLSRER